jgi:hypothetical protein
MTNTRRDKGNILLSSIIANATTDFLKCDLVGRSMDYAEMNSFNIEGRYPDTLSPSPSEEEAQHYMTQAEEVFQWLISIF